MDGDVFRRVTGFERVAARRISPETFGFVASAADEQSSEENVKAFRRWRFRPRLMRNVREIDTSPNDLGSKLPFPICIAPTALHREATKEGEVATAKAAETLGIGMVLSIASSRPLEDVALKVPNCIRWCHLHVSKKRDILTSYMRKAEQKGFTGFIVTIDQPVQSKRPLKTHDGTSFHFRLRYRLENLEPVARADKQINVDLPGEYDKDFKYFMDSSNEWGDFDWMKNVTSLPIAVKGVLTEEMALEALNHGVDAIIVSNHGGRQLDSTFATVVRAVNGKCDVYIDGGIRSGNDIAKAIALGAKAVFIGRPVLWGLAVDVRVCNEFVNATTDGHLFRQGTNGARKVLERKREMSS